MTSLLLSALITLAVDVPTNTVSEYRVYVGLSPNAYFTFYTFPETNRFTISVTNNNRIYLACSALNGTNESDLSSEIVVMIFPGWVQLSSGQFGPWTNYLPISVPVQVVEPQRFVRVRLETQ